MANLILEVPDISCAHCERTVTNALNGQTGVNSVRVDVPQKLVFLDYDPSALKLDQVKEALDEEGYPVAATREGTQVARL